MVSKQAIDVMGGTLAGAASQSRTLGQMGMISKMSGKIKSSLKLINSSVLKIKSKRKRWFNEKNH